MGVVADFNMGSFGRFNNYLIANVIIIHVAIIIWDICAKNDQRQ